MCFICEFKDMVDIQPVRASERDAVCAIARQHAQVLEQALPASRIITPVLLGEIPEDGYTAAVEWAVQDDGVTHVLTARVPDAERYLKVTYELVDLTRKVNYTGNGPEGQSVIGLDAIEAALEHMSSVRTKMEATRDAVSAILPPTAFDHELHMIGLIQRCLTALREHTK